MTANRSKGFNMTVAAYVRVSARNQKDDGQRAEIEKKSPAHGEGVGQHHERELTEGHCYLEQDLASNGGGYTTLPVTPSSTPGTSSSAMKDSCPENGEARFAVNIEENPNCR